MFFKKNINSINYANFVCKNGFFYPRWFSKGGAGCLLVVLVIEMASFKYACVVLFGYFFFWLVFFVHL